MYGNELTMKFSMDDGRIFEAKRGMIDADIGYESHGMFVMKLKFDWGIYTYNSILLDKCTSFGNSTEGSTYEPRSYSQDLIKAMLKVCNVNYFSSLKNHEMYILFDEERNQPKGIVNIHDIQNSLIFDDLVKHN